METIEKKSLIYEISERTNCGVKDIDKILNAAICVLSDGAIVENYKIELNGKQIQINN